jgi:hypothetical protein
MMWMHCLGLENKAKMKNLPAADTLAGFFNHAFLFSPIAGSLSH